MIPTIQRKFTRKKYHPPPPVAITVKNYEANLSPEERYRRHFMMWQFWHAEIVEGLGDSRKKALRATEETLAELAILQGLVQPEKGQALTPHIEALGRLRHELDKDVVSGQASYRWRMTLERQQRDIQREFAWKHVDDDLMPPEHERTSLPPPPDAPTETTQEP